MERQEQGAIGDIITIDLRELKKCAPNFTPNQCNGRSEACAVAFEHNHHKPYCLLEVYGDKKTYFSIFWEEGIPTEGYKNEDKFIELGAEVISFFLGTHFTQYKIVEEAKKKTGIDYWLGYDKSHPSYNPNKLFYARLEISGINKETSSNNIKSRLPIKKKQTERSDSSGLPVYISVVEFSKPQAIFIRK